MLRKILPALFGFCIFYAAAQPPANGKITVYFDRPVNNALATNYDAVFLNGAWGDTLAAYINRAKYTIDVTQYDYTWSTTASVIATAIDSAYSRGVTIRWIYNGSSSNSGLSHLSAGIPTLGRPSGNGIMHDKFVVIDNGHSNPEPIVWTGSPDWSQEMIDSDVNNIIIFQDSALAQAYTAQFNQMWGSTTPTPNSSNAKWGPAKTSMGPHIFTIGGVEVELYFSPTDSVNNHILDVINSADEQLYFGVYCLTESSDANAIISKYQAGVSTYGVLDQYSAQATGGQYSTMKTALGSHLLEYTRNTSLYHNKYMVVDACDLSSDPQVLTGSHNWTNSANTENDENTLIIHDATTANIYYQAINADFVSMLGGNMTTCTVASPCLNAISTTVQVNDSVACYGQATGAATVHAHGAHAPFSYSWNSNPVQTDSTLSNAAAGTYSVTVTDANQCSATAPVTIAQPASALSVSVSTTGELCFGDSAGTGTASVSGGTGSYQYKWSTSPQQTGITALNLSATSYFVTVTDANNCSATSWGAVSQPGQILIQGTATAAGCLNASNGSISTSTSGGTASYHYAWNTNPQQTSANASNLSAGNYTLTVTDANNCTATASFTVTQPNTGITLSTSSTSTSCGGSNGSATVSVITGTGPFTYAWSGGGGSATDNNLAAGSYTVTVSAGGCSATAGAIVNSSGAPVISATAINTTCGNNNGWAFASVSSGNGPFTYAWSNNASTDTIVNLSPGAYIVTVYDNSHCGAVANATVGASSGVTLNTPTTTASCNGTGTASVTVLTGTSPYHYVWNNSDTSSSPQGLGPGNYSVTVTDNNQCTASAAAIVSSAGGPTLFISVTSATCGLINGSAAASDTGGTSPYRYRWSNGDTAASISNLPAGTYNITVTDAGGCSVTGSADVTSINTSDSFNITASATAICFGDSAQLCAPGGYSSYEWSTGFASDCMYAVQSGTYSATATVTGGCVSVSNPIAITVLPPLQDTLAISGDTLKVAPGNTYQWYQNSEVITGATSNFYIPAASAYYYAQITNSAGCAANTAVIFVTVSGIKGLTPDNEINIYPNPSVGSLPAGKAGWHLAVSNEFIGSQMEVYNATGQLVFKGTIDQETSTLEIPGIPSGIYELRIISSQGIFVRKLVRM